MTIRIQKLRDNAVLPAYQSDMAAGADLYAALEAPLTLAPMDRALVPTGIAAQPDREDCVLVIAARSGLAVKKGVTLSNGIGVVDADYRGEICVGLVNLGKDTVTIEPGDRIAQLLVMPVLRAVFTEADSLDGTDRGTGGFGHTGTK
ncbi:MAG: dUTP diphosphatase [Clostridia bacterium]|nr:dUTP diphosphatase [Clostridia bacterium]MBQ4607551.1 dUTP diphosphatase [Clostridia bacterium]